MHAPNRVCIHSNQHWSKGFFGSLTVSAASQNPSTGFGGKLVGASGGRPSATS